MNPTGGGGSARGRRALAALLLLGVVGCQAPPPSSDARAGAAAALDGFGEAVFQAFLAADTAALEARRLNETEHNQEVYPHLPAGRDGGFPVEMAWENIQLRHYRDRDRQLSRLVGREAWYGDTFCLGETRSFETFQVMTDCWVRFEDARAGAMRVQLFKDVLVPASGPLKAFRYYDDDPRRVETP